MQKNIISIYWENQAIKIAESSQDKKYKYIILWVDSFIKHIFDNFDFISVELIKKEMPIFYNKLIKK